MLIDAFNTKNVSIYLILTTFWDEITFGHLTW